MRNIVRISVILLVVTIGCLSLQSCGTKKNTIVKTDTDLSGNWSLYTLNGKDAASLFKGSIPSMTLDHGKHSITGNGGCNTFTGEYTYEEGRFNAPNLISTLMMCVEENDESELLKVLTTESIVKMTGDKLSFYKKGIKVAEFSKAIDTVLLSGEWILDTINGESASSVFNNTEQIPTITFFTADKRISGMAGCNSYNAPFTINGYLLNVGAIVTTRMACPNVMQGEADFIQALSNSSTLKLKDNVLSLIKNKREVLKFIKTND